jgi:hypothetical protein
MTRRRLLATVVALALGAVPAGFARAGESLSDGRFRLEWETATSRKGPRLEGTLHNLMLRPVQNVTVLVEQLDESGQAVRRSTIRVWGGVPAGDRAFFEVPGVTAGARYRLSVVNYDLQPVGGGG